MKKNALNHLAWILAAGGLGIGALIPGSWPLSVAIQAAAADEATVFGSHGRGIQATFSGVDGCIRSDVYVSANTNTEHTPPASAVSAGLVTMLVSQSDLCALDTVFFGDGSTTTFSMEISPRLDRATVSAIVPVLNFNNGLESHIAVELSLTATSPKIIENVEERLDLGSGSVLHQRFHHAYRTATAIGSMVGTPVPLATPPTTDAEIEDVKLDEITVSH